MSKGPLRAFWDLSFQERRMLRSSHISGTRPVKEWVDILSRLAARDLHGDELRKLFGWLAAATAVITFLGLAFDAPMIGLTFAGITLVSLILWKILSSMDLSAPFRELVVPWVMILKEDMHPDAPLTLEIDLSGGCQRSKRYRSTGGGAGSFMFGGIRTTWYVDPWLRGRARLLNKARMSFAVTDRIRERRISKRSSSGKIKTKYKYKTKQEMQVQITLPPGRWARPNRDVEVRADGDRRILTVKRLKVSRTEGAAPSLAALLALPTAAWAAVVPREESER